MNINLYDIETFKKESKVVPYCICFLLNKEKFYIYKDEYIEQDSDILLEFLYTVIQNSERDVTLFSHNINFDGLLIIETLTKRGIFFEWFNRNNNIYWIKIYIMGFIITLRCSLKIIPMSIKKMGEISKMNKLVFPYTFVNENNLDYIGPCPDEIYFENHEDWLDFKKENDVFNMKEKTIEYCFRDLDVLNDFIIKIFGIINSYDKKVLKNTYSFSSISYKIFSKHFDKFKITKEKVGEIEYKYALKSLVGGRCEVFGNPTDEYLVHHFDFPGMYANNMRTNKFPVGKHHFKSKNLDYNEIGLHTIRVRSDMNIPFLPLHYNKKLMFPNGEFVITLPHISIPPFLKWGGKILDHYSSLVYDNEEYVFKEYVEEFIKLRQNAYYKVFGKSMNNGLYGSFALKESDSEHIIVSSEKELEEFIKITNVESWKKINKLIVIEIKKDHLSNKFFNIKSRYSEDNEVRRNVIYSSYISAYSRNQLYESFMTVIKNNGVLYYTDTDSIFAGFKNNYIGKKMGDITWSDIYEDAVFIAPKFYYLKESEFKIKGINKPKADFQQIKNDFYNNKNELIFTNQLQFEKKNHILIQKYIEKKIKLNSYNKRIFSENKKQTFPINVSN